MFSHFSNVEHWRAWEALVERYPGRESELSAIVLVLIQRSDAEDPVLWALSEAPIAAESGAAASVPFHPVVPANPTRPPWWAWASLAAAAVSMLILMLPRATETQFRGTPATSTTGEVYVLRDGEILTRSMPGLGIRPHAAAGPATIRWTGEESAWMWRVPDGAVMPLNVDRPIEPSPGEVWAFAVLPPDAEPEEIRALVGDGTQAVVGLAQTRLLFVDWTP